MTDGGGERPVAQSRLGLLGMVTILASALVGFNTFVVGCSNERAARDAAQLHQIEERERFWTEAMRDLGDLLRAKSEPAADAAAWEVRCALLGARTAPFIEGKIRDDIRAEDGEIETTRALLALELRAFDLQEAFVDQISNEDVVGETCATRYAKERERAIRKDDKKQKKELTAEKDGMATADPTTQAIIARQDLIELTGLSETGWDIDVFWCERADDDAASERNFTDALKLGEDLAKLEREQGSLGKFRLGRIRVRMLAALLQGSEAYVSHANARHVVAEAASDGEPDLAAQIASVAQPQLAAVMRTPDSTSPPTPYYLSAFMCGAGTAPPPDSAIAPSDAASAMAN